MGKPLPRFAFTTLSVSLLLASAFQTAQASETELPAISVTGEDSLGYQADTASVGEFDAAPLLDTPEAVSVFTQALIQDQQARLLSDVLKNDASFNTSLSRRAC